MPRNIPEQDVHAVVVCQIAQMLSQNGWDLAVDGECGVEESLVLPCFPDRIKGCEDAHCRTPDLYAKKERETLIIEVETENTISDHRTRCQMMVFSRQGLTQVWVPKASVEDMEANLKSWKVGWVVVFEY